MVSAPPRGEGIGTQSIPPRQLSILARAIFAATIAAARVRRLYRPLTPPGGRRTPLGASSSGPRGEDAIASLRPLR